MNYIKNKLFILCILFRLSFAYEVGDEVNIIDQNKTFEICYGDNLDLDGDGIIKLADFNGDLNGGHYYVILIDMSATWCGPCYSLIPYFDNVLETWEGYEHFIGIIALSDLNQPYSCTQWGNLGTSGIPLIIDDVIRIENEFFSKLNQETFNFINSLKLVLGKKIRIKANYNE